MTRPSPEPQIELVGLTDELDAEAVVWLLLDQVEAVAEVDTASSGERMIGPQLHTPVARRFGKLERRAHQARADVSTAGARVDEQDPQPGCLWIVAAHAEDAAGSLAAELGDPGRVVFIAGFACVVGHDPGHERLEAGIPAELGGVHLTVGHHHPAEIARLSERADERGRRVPVHLSSLLHKSTETVVSVVDYRTVPESVPAVSARRDELLERAYRYVLEHGLSAVSLRPLAAAVRSSPRVLLFLFGSKDGLVRALLARARADELELLDRLESSDRPGLARAGRQVWEWLCADRHRGLLKLWAESYGRSLVEPAGPWAGFAESTVADWLELLAGAQLAGERDTALAETQRTVVLAALRGALLDLLATGDRARTTRAVDHVLERLDRDAG